jgi:thymidylate synthase (FAD)
MFVERLEDTNDDLTVVNAARVSFNKESGYVALCNADCGEHGWGPDENCPNCEVTLVESDKKLINYLASHEHWTPFGHPIFCFKHTLASEDAIEYLSQHAEGYSSKLIIDQGALSGNTIILESASLYEIIGREVVPQAMWNVVATACPVSTSAFHPVVFQHPGWGITVLEGDDVPAPLRWARFRLKMPIFVAREWFRHTKGFVRNEVSRRYVDDLPDCWLPDSYRTRHSSKKQGSTKEAPKKNAELLKSAKIMTDMVVQFYETLLENEVAPEMARHILPQSMYTEFIETAYVEDYERLLGLRLQPDAQKEIQEVAAMLKEQL